jgi:hypothetical protein
MFILWLFNSLGLIVGSVMLLALVVALVLCLLATFRPSALRLRRRAFYGAFAPFAVGIGGFIWGIVLLLPAGGMQQDVWLNLGKVVLAGAVVSLGPLVWSLLLYRTPRAVA